MRMGVLWFSTVLISIATAYFWANSLRALSIPDSHHYVEFIAQGTPHLFRIVGKGENNCTGIVTNHRGKIQCRLEDIKTGMRLRDRHMLGYLHADVHPMVTLTFEAKGDKFDGILELNGKRGAVSGTYKSDPLKFEFKINIEDFGIEAPKYLGIGIEPDISISAGLR